MIRTAAIAALLLSVIAAPSAQAEEGVEAESVDRQRKLFLQYDTNGDGFVNYFEYMNGGKLRFSAIDSNKDGVITLEEARISSGETSEKPGRNSAGAYISKRDLNKDGILTQYEAMQTSIKTYKTIDTNKDLVMTFEEFLPFFQNEYAPR